MMASKGLTSQEIERELYADTDSDEFSEYDDSSDDSETDLDTLSHDTQQTSNWRPVTRTGLKNKTVRKFIGDNMGKKQTVAPHVNKDSTPVTVFMIYFMEIISLLVTETNRYYHQYLDRQDIPTSPLPDVSQPEMMKFLGIVLQMGHDIKDTLHDYFTKIEQFMTPFYSNTMRRDRFLHILRFLHFADNDREIDRNDQNYDRLWKIRDVFEILRDSYAKYYNPSENLAVDEVIVLFKGRVIFKQYIPKKHKRFGIKIYKLCDSTGFTYDLDVYLGKDRLKTTHGMTATHKTVKTLTQKVRGRGHKLYMDNFFSSPDLFEDLQKDKIFCCGTVRNTRQGMPQDFKKLKLKRGDLRVRSKGDMTALVWKDKRDVHMLTNIHDAPTEGNFCNEHGIAKKPLIVEEYNRHMGYVDKSDRMANSYSISRRTWKWTKKLFFHLLDMTVLNSYLLLTSCGAKVTHRDFRLALVRELVLLGVRESAPHPRLGRPSAISTRVARLEEGTRKHWPTTSTTRMDCVVCSTRGKTRRRIQTKCEKCNVGLCISGCFKDYHTKSTL